MPEQSVLITGGAGMLAGRLAANFRAQGWEVHAPCRADLDITDENAILACLQGIRPSAVVNTAAMLVEPCEADPKAAFLINAWSVRNLARACDRLGTQLVQISTSGVFGDVVRPFHEFDPVVNKTRYAASKHAGETFAREWCERHIILRLGWLYGGGMDAKRDFVTARLEEAAANPVMRCAADKYGCPTNADDVASTLLSLLDGHIYGVFHCANTADIPCARADYVEAILKAAGSDTRVERVSSSSFPRAANVPDCEWLTSYALEYAGIPLLPHWRESLDRYMSQLPR